MHVFSCLLLPCIQIFAASKAKLIPAKFWISLCYRIVLGVLGEDEANALSGAGIVLDKNLNGTNSDGLVGWLESSFISYRSMLVLQESCSTVGIGFFSFGGCGIKPSTGGREKISNVRSLAVLLGEWAICSAKPYHERECIKLCLQGGYVCAYLQFVVRFIMPPVPGEWVVEQ